MTINMNAKDRYDKIHSLLAGGATVMICTPLKCTEITAKTVDRFEANGTPLFKIGGKSLYMLEGRKYVCIDYTTIKAYK